MNESKMRRRAIWEAMSPEEQSELACGTPETWPSIGEQPPLILVLGSPADPGPSAPTHKTPSGVATTSGRDGVRGILLPSRELLKDETRYRPHTRTRAEMMMRFADWRDFRETMAIKDGRKAPPTEEESKLRRRLEQRSAHRQARVDAKRARLERQRERRAKNAMREQMKAIAMAKREAERMAPALADAGVVRMEVGREVYVNGVHVGSTEPAP